MQSYHTIFYEVHPFLHRSGFFYIPDWSDKHFIDSHMQEHTHTDKGLHLIYGSHHLCTVEERKSPCARNHDMQDLDMTLECYLAWVVACGNNIGIQSRMQSRWWCTQAPIWWWYTPTLWRTPAVQPQMKELNRHDS